MGHPVDDSDPLARERKRVGRVYARYRASRRKRGAWAADNAGNLHIREELLAAVRWHAKSELYSRGEVLDVGCGGGFWLAALRESTVERKRLVGVDILPERVEAARQRVPQADVRQADARSLPFESNRFSLVLLLTLLSSLETEADGRAALGEARRVLRPDGLLLCYEPRLPNPLNRRVRSIRDGELDLAGIRPRTERRLTLLPPLARRLGRRTDAVYPKLARIRPLQSHRLIIHRKGGDPHTDPSDVSQ